MVLLDEPTTGLDPQARRLLWETLRGLHERGTTFILTTHYMEEADRLCQRLAIVDHGKILTLDTPAALKKSLPGGAGPGPLGRAPRSRSRRGSARSRASSTSRRSRPAGRGTASSGCASSWIRPTASSTACSTPCATAGADLHHVSLAQPSLEDVYIHLTGRGLRE